MTDGNADTYWESANGAFPQWVQVDLGAATSIGRVALKLPPAAAWATRTQTLSVQTSTNGIVVHDGRRVGGPHVQPGHRQHGEHRSARDDAPGTSG